jgi:hypothetical protein
MNRKCFLKGARGAIAGRDVAVVLMATIKGGDPECIIEAEPA